MPSDVLPYSTLYLSSNHADQTGSNSNFTFTMLGRPMESVPDNKNIKVAILSATLPNVYTNVSALNNTIVITEVTDDLDPVTYTFTLTPGAYVIAALLTELNTKLNAASITLGHSFTYACTQTNGRITFITTSVLAGAVATLEVEDERFTALRVLGLSDNVGPDDTSFAVGDNYVAPYVADLTNFTGPQEVLIRCSQVTSRCYEARTKNVSDILAVVQNNVINAEMNLVYNPSVPKIIATLGRTINQLTFRITDYNGTELTGIAAPVTLLVGLYHFNNE